MSADSVITERQLARVVMAIEKSVERHEEDCTLRLRVLSAIEKQIETSTGHLNLSRGAIAARLRVDPYNLHFLMQRPALQDVRRFWLEAIHRQIQMQRRVRFLQEKRKRSIRSKKMREQGGDRLLVALIQNDTG